MSLSQNSKLLMSFLLEKKSIQHKQHTKKTDTIIKKLEGIKSKKVYTI